MYECDVCGKRVYGDFMAVDSNNVKYCKECLIHPKIKCAICGAEEGFHLIGEKWICSDCFGSNPLVSSLTERNKFEQEHPEIFPPEKTIEQLHEMEKTAKRIG